MTDAIPAMHRLALTVFIYNTGAAATVVRDFAAENFQEGTAGNPLFAGIEPPTGPTSVELPLVLERDDASPVRFRLDLAIARDQPIADAAEYARRLAGLRSVAVTLSWTYRGRRFPLVWRRAWITRHRRLTIPAAAFREHVKRQWRANDATAYLAEIAEGREPA